ncbi:MAG: glycoside hydrolase family 15 protein [Thermoplasmata archaeon]
MASKEDYLSIGDYGLIGDMNSAALVSREGSIDWLCFPRFDSPSVFAHILDPKRGGRLDVSVTGAETEQAYVEDTNVLRTVFKGPEGTLELVDFMPCYRKDYEYEAYHEVHRRLRCMDGKITLDVVFDPRFGYSREETRVEVHEGGCLAEGELTWLSLVSDIPFQEAKNGATAEVSLEEGEERWLILRWNEDSLRPLAEFLAAEKLEKTVDYWRGWTERCTYRGPFEDLVRRSLLALKLMIYEPTGAIVAAPTTSLPEIPGGPKNWDYRYSWLRDAAFALRAFHKCGYDEEERGYRHWVMRRLQGHTLHPEELQIMYGVEGDRRLLERSLPHLRGYRGAKPVRIGNAAHDQHQLDMCGALIDALYLSYRTDEDMNDHVWRTIAELAEFVAAKWEEPDYGIWELRGEKRRYIYSQVMAWVALDRAARVGRRWGNPRRAERWEDIAAEIRAHTLEVGFDKELNSFVQYEGAKEVDGSLLLMPIVYFIDENDPRWQGTLERIQSELGDGAHIWRLKDERPQEGSFLMLSFWLADVLIHGGHLEAGREALEQVMGYANHLGLFAEMWNPEAGEFLGNFPQALTHMALINAAHTLWDAETGTAS